MGDALCEFSFSYTGASKEEHDEGMVRIDLAILTQADGRRDRPNWTPLSDDIFSNNFFDPNCGVVSKNLW